MKKPGEVWYIPILVSDPVSNIPRDPDGNAITAVLYRGNDVTAESFTTTRLGIGRYFLSVTIPIDWLAIDDAIAFAQCDIDGLEYAGVATEGVDSHRIGEVGDLAETDGVAVDWNAITNKTATVNLSGTSVGLTAAAIASIWAALTAALTTVGSIGKFIVDNLGAAIGGTGARTVTITVNDGATVLEDAIVRLSQGGESYIADTNASGVVTFNVDDATWTVAITKPGYSFAGTTLVVDGNETVTYSMDSTAFSTPADPEFCTLAIRVWGHGTGAVAVGVDVNAQITEAPEGTGEMFNDATMTETTGADGYVEFTVPKGCSVRYWIGNSSKQIDAIEEDTVEFVTNWLGHE